MPSPHANAVGVCYLFAHAGNLATESAVNEIRSCTVSTAGAGERSGTSIDLEGRSSRGPIDPLTDLSAPCAARSDKPSTLSDTAPLHAQIRDAAAALAWMTGCRTADQAAQVQQQFHRLLALAERVKPMERFCDEIARDCAEQERVQAAAERRRAAIATGRVVELAAHRQPHRAWSGDGGAA